MEDSIEGKGQGQQCLQSILLKIRVKVNSVHGGFYRR